MWPLNSASTINAAALSHARMALSGRPAEGDVFAGYLPEGPSFAFQEPPPAVAAPLNVEGIRRHQIAPAAGRATGSRSGRRGQCAGHRRRLTRLFFGFVITGRHRDLGRRLQDQDLAEHRCRHPRGDA